MKKSLSLVLAIAMVFSMFASVAFAAEGTTELTPQQQFDALKEKGIFTGYEDGSAGLDKNMTRAEFAVVLTKLYGLTEDASAANYTDLTGYNWAKGYIGAATKAGFMRGYGNGKFNPGGNITVEELTVVYVISSGLQPVAGANVAGASKWAAGYVQAALDAGIIKAQSSYTAPAKRELLVTATYTVYQQIESKNKVAVTEVKQSGAKEISVVFNKAVADADKAKFEVKRDGSTQTNYKVEWSDDKKTARLVFDAKLIDATYSVTVTGLANLDTSKNSGQVTASREKITKIEFVTASDTLPQSDDVLIEFKALNQFNQEANVNANDFTIRLSDDDIDIRTKTDETAFTLDLYEEDDRGDNIFERGDRFSVTIIDEEDNVQANKIFTIGDEPIVSKIELGDLVDKDGKKIDYIKTTYGEKAYLQYTAYDQYGLKVINKDILNGSRGVTVVSSDRDLNPGTETSDDEPFVDDVDGDDKDDLQLTYAEDDKSRQTAKEVTITAYAAGTSASKVVKLAAVKQPSSIEIPAFNGVIADGDVDKFIPIVVKDSNGDKLSAQDIRENVDKFRVWANGPIDIASDEEGVVENGIQLTGDDAGKIAIGSVDGTGNSRIEISLREKPEVKASISLNVVKKRYPNTIKWVDADNTLADKAVVGAEAKFKVKTFDQYNEEYKNAVADRYHDYWVVVSLEKVGSAPNTATITGPDGRTIAVGGSAEYKISDKDADANRIWDREFVFKGTAEGTYKVKLQYIDKADLDRNNNPKNVGEALSKNIEVISGTDTDQNLTYEVKLDKFNADKGIMAVGTVYEKSVGDSVYGENASFSTLVQKTNFAKEIKLSAKDEAGRTIAISKNITDVTTSNAGVVGAAKKGDTWYVVGKKEGTASITVKFATTRGTATASISVKVVNSTPDVQSISLDKTSKYRKSSEIEGKKVWDGLFAENVKVTDQFGDEFEKQAIVDYSDVLGVTFSVGDMKWKDGTSLASQDKVTVDEDGTLHYFNNDGAGNNLKSFVIYVTAPNGKKASIEVLLND